MGKARVLVVVVLLSPQITVIGQEERPMLPERAAAQIAEITKLLNWERLQQLPESAWQAEQARATGAIRAAVTRFVESSLSTSDDRETIQARLRAVLVNHRTEGMEGYDAPTARAADLRFGRSTVLSYVVVRPPHFSSGLLCGFRVDAGRYRLVSTAGEEFEGYGWATDLLPSPSPDELWILARGKAHTFNGTLIRFRVYSFDGGEFTTMWSPDDLFDAEVKITTKGFIINHTPPELNHYVTEEYVVLPGGVARVG